MDRYVFLTGYCGGKKRKSMMPKERVCHRISALLILASTLIISANLAHASDWIQDGWQKIDQNNTENALTVWQNGVNALPPSQLLIFVGVYAAPSAAIRQLKRAGRDQQVIILHADFRGEKSYYVMSALDVPADRAARREQFAALRKAIRASSWLYGNEARKFQSAATAQTHITAPVQPSVTVNPEQLFATGKYAPGKVKQHTFPIHSFDIHGNTLVATDSIRNHIKHYLGQHKTWGDVFRARRAIVSLYAEAGFNHVTVIKLKRSTRQKYSGVIPLLILD